MTAAYRPPEDPRPVRFSTLSDAIAHVVAPALGEYAADHDLVGIAREAFAYRVDHDEHGRERLDTAGYEQVATGDEFARIIERHTTRPMAVPTWTVGDRLRKAREAAGLTADALASSLGIHRNSASNYELGHRTPPRSIVAAWADRTGVDEAWLRGDDDGAAS